MRTLIAASIMALAAGIGTAQAADPSRSTACDPRNVPPNERADWLHQSRPGGSDCTPQSALQSERDALAKQNRRMRNERSDDRYSDRYGGYDRRYDRRYDRYDYPDVGSGSSSAPWR